MKRKHTSNLEMETIVLENHFLKETPLTSTVNKYLLESDLTVCPELLIRELQDVYQSTLTCTKNEFLEENATMSLGQKVKKKKRKKEFEVESFSAPVTLGYQRHQKGFRGDFQMQQKRGLRKCKPKNTHIERLRSVAAFRCKMADEEDVSQTALNQEISMSSVDGSSLSFQSSNMNQLGSVPEQNFSFGSATFEKPTFAVPTYKQTLACAPRSSAPHRFVSSQISLSSNQLSCALGQGILFGSPAGSSISNNLPQQFRSIQGFYPLQKTNAFPVISCPDISEMPVYTFSSGFFNETDNLEPNKFCSMEMDTFQFERVQKIKSKKIMLLNSASMALMLSSDLKNVNDPYRAFIKKCADDVLVFDPEFILKVTLYARQELNIRSVSNFLLSYAAYHKDTRPFLEKYFESSIRLPSDWIEVADLYQIYKDERLKIGSLPASLKKVMRNSFKKFDEYQLAKYNRCNKKSNEEKGRKREHKSLYEEPKAFTLKRLIKLLHIDSPANEIMCLLGKKYPETPETFKKCGLSGNWDSRRAGKRMKLTQPMTWETQISAHGNKPNVWEGLIDANKLPYMAMLRNLRNLILSGISQKHHEKVLKQLENKQAVINSHQLPLQFYEAFKVVSKLANISNDKAIENNNTKISAWKKKQMERTSVRIQNVSSSILDRYKSAVNKALEISSLHNLHPIPGKTLVICDIFFREVKKDDKAKERIFETCLMMALMCLKACESCRLCVLEINRSNTVSLNENDETLKILMELSESYRHLTHLKKPDSILSLKKVLDFYLKPQAIFSEKLDHIIFLKAGDLSSKMQEEMTSFLNKYRQIVNSELLYTDVNFSLSNKSFTNTHRDDGKDVFLCGTSAQLIKYIAERSSDGQLTCVENIDKKYKLKNINLCETTKTYGDSDAESVLHPYSLVPKWYSVRVFISSTFKDMHSERDMLIRFVMPELKKRAASVFVKINEVDLRWGVTESDHPTKHVAEQCLLEAQKSDIFIGLLGARYGTVYSFEPLDHFAPDSPELQWVKEYKNLSITELEMHAGALREEKLKAKKGFFYFRDMSFLNQVPDKWKEYFSSESLAATVKVEELKSKILASGAKVFNGYPCSFAGIHKGKPVLKDLDAFGKAALEDLWHTIKQVHENDQFMDYVSEEEENQKSLLNNFDCFIGERNCLAENFFKEIKKNNGIFLISGSPGSGKTTFVVNLLKKLENYTVIKFFIGLTPRSTDVRYMLQYLTESISRKLTISSVFPKLSSDIMNNFPDILQEAVTCGNNNFILLIDGLDHLDSDAQVLDWLPLTLPRNFKLICSASESSYVFKSLCERKAYGNPLHLLSLIALSQSQRELIVKHYLTLYGKYLEQSSFNNQMLLMVTKKDSSIPLYLRLSCDFLRIYATFENFMSMLQSLPTSIPLVLQEVIIQMENEYGSILVHAALTFLCITKEGLDDSDLHTLLSVISLDSKNIDACSFDETLKKIISLNPDSFIPQVKFFSLLNLICTFAFGHIRSNNINLFGTELQKAVQKHYLNKNHASFEKKMHFLLAAYYHTICDPGNNGTYKTNFGYAYRGLLHHLYQGKCYEELSNLLCNLKFLKATFMVEAGELLMEYYTYLLEENQGRREIKGVNSEVLDSFKTFVSRNMHILQKYPGLTLQQALNEPSSSHVKFGDNESKSWMVESLSEPKVSDCRISTLRGFMKPITAIACQERKSFAALGSEDGYLKILDFTSRKVVRNLKSHTSAINFICFGGKNRICTASNDTTLNIWSSEDYSLISVLKGHRHRVTCCCADPSGGILFSSGWDNSVRLWSLRDGRSVSVIDDFRCPVNSVDHHPMKQQIVCGLWNGSIEIWDSVSLKRLITSASHCGSVKSIAYSPDGITIISAFINSDVAIWSAEEGLKLTILKGHALPVKSIVFSYERSLIVSGSEDCTLKVWPTEIGLFVNVLSACKFSPISMIQIISRDYIMVIFQNSDIWVMHIFSGHVTAKFVLQSDIVACVSKPEHISYKQDDVRQLWIDSSVVFGTQSGLVLIGDLITSSITTVGKMNSRVSCIAHSSLMVVCGNSDGDIGVFTYPKFESTFIYGAHKGSVIFLSLYAEFDNLMALSSGYEQTIKSWEISTKEDIKIDLCRNWTTPHRDGITCCHVYPSEDGNKLLLTGSHDNTINYIPISVMNEEGKELTLTGLKTSVVSVDFVGNYILGCASDGSIAMWSKDGKLASYIPGIKQSSAILSFHIEKDINGMFDVTLCFVDKDGTIKVTKPTQKSYSYSLEGHSKSITSCCINRNGDIVSSSLDGTINLWKLTMEIPDTQHHKSPINGIIVSITHNVVISSDILGTIILWKLDSIFKKSSLMCLAKKSYSGGFIKAISWKNDTTFVAALTQVNDKKESHFLDIIQFEPIKLEDQNLYSLQVIHSYCLECEVLSLDVNVETQNITASFKSGEVLIITPDLEKNIKLVTDSNSEQSSLYNSDLDSNSNSEESILSLVFAPESINDNLKSGEGNVVVITPDLKKSIKPSQDWVLSVKLLSLDDGLEYLFFPLLSGKVMSCLMSDALKYKNPPNYSSYFDSNWDDFYTSAFFCKSKESIFCGDSEGKLRVYGEQNICKKVHENSITGLVQIGKYVFTSSLDRTVKGWFTTTFEQVCQFCLSEPITKLTGQEVLSEDSSSMYILVIGTFSGTVQVVKFYPA